MKIHEKYKHKPNVEEYNRLTRIWVKNYKKLEEYYVINLQVMSKILL